MLLRFLQRSAPRLPPAVNTDGLPGDEPGAIGGQIRNHRRYLVRAAEAADRDCLGALAETDLQVVAEFAAIGADCARGADRSRQHSIHRDAARREVERE